MKGKMPNFHLIYENNKYSVKTTQYGLLDNTLCTIDLDLNIDETKLNEIFLGVDTPTTFLCKEQAASMFFLSTEMIKKKVVRNSDARKRILIPRKRHY